MKKIVVLVLLVTGVVCAGKKESNGLREFEGRLTPLQWKLINEACERKHSSAAANKKINIVSRHLDEDQSDVHSVFSTDSATDIVSEVKFPYFSSKNK